VLTRLAGRGINERMSKPARRLTGALIDADLADELLVYMAPTILGPGRPFATLPGRTELPPNAGYRWVACDPVATISGYGCVGCRRADTRRAVLYSHPSRRCALHRPLGRQLPSGKCLIQRCILMVARVCMILGI